jgi:isopenicillin N synthase-like dioxygenase
MKEYNLHDNCVEMITYPDDLRNKVLRASVLWNEFCQLPDVTKQKLATSDTQSGIGYELKEKTGANTDRKENFDFNIAGSQELHEIVAGINNETVTNFVTSIQDLQTNLLPMIQQFGRDTNNEEFESLAIRSADNVFFRFLHYPAGAQIGELIAEPHTDHSGFTFHLYETTDGCEQLATNGVWEPLPVNHDELAAFGGMQTQLVTKGLIRALCHRVTANEISSKNGRFAIVCFVALEGIKKYNKKRHGRLQEKEPGFNYHMQEDEFKELFE